MMRSKDDADHMANEQEKQFPTPYIKYTNTIGMPMVFVGTGSSKLTHKGINIKQTYTMGMPTVFAGSGSS